MFKIRLRKQALGAAITGWMALFASSMVSALGLGDIELRSNINEPLHAEIPLLEVGELGTTEILISLASDEDFDRLGVERTFFLSDLRFLVKLDERGGPVIAVDSRRAVREPFLDFVVELRWPSGKLLREYTLLLDLPTFSDDAPAQISSTQSRSVAPAPAPQRSEPVEPAPETRANPRSSYSGGRSDTYSSYSSTGSSSGTYAQDSYRVSKNDTLWDIALAVRPDRGTSVHQTMMALHEANPQAFINGNINLLKSGQVLRIPDREEIRQLNQNQAVRAVAQHNAEWSGGERAAPLDASRSSYEQANTETSGEGRLSLTSPENAYDSQAGRIDSAGGEVSSDAAAVKEELAATLETLDKARGENSELRTKVSSLEEQISTMESMLQVTNDKLRAMELAAAGGESSDVEAPAAESIDQVYEEAAESAVDEEGISDTDETIGTDTAEIADAGVAEDEVMATDEKADAAVKAEQAQAEKAKEKVVSRPKPKKEAGWLSFVKEYIIFIGLGLVALIGLVILVIRQRSQDDGFDDLFDESLDDEEPTSLDEQDEEEFPEELEDAAIESDGSQEPVDELDDTPEPETDDVVAETDIYIAYGKYDQAEEMLQKALERDPSHHEARLKLLEIYATQGNIDAFDPNYAALRSGGADESLVERAETLRSEIPDAGMFDEDLYSTSDNEPAAPSEDDSSENEFDIETGHETELDLDIIGEGGDTDEELSLSLDDSVLSGETDADEAGTLDLTDLGETLDDIELDTEASGDLDGKLEDIEFDLENLDFEDADGIEIEPELDPDDAPVAEGIDGELDLTSLEDSGDGLDLELEASDSPLSGSDIEGDLADIDLDLSDEDSLEFSEDDLDIDLGDSDTSEIDTEINFAVDGLETEVEPDIEALSLEPEETKDDEVQLEEDNLDLDDSDDFDLESLDKELESLTDDLNEDDTDLDLKDLTQELEESTSENAELEVESDTSDFDLADLEKELDSEEDDLNDIDLGEVDLGEVDLSVAQEELDATIAEGEDILAGLDADLSELDEAEVELEEPASDFDSLELVEDSEESAEEAAVLNEPDTDFDSFELDEPEDDVEEVSSGEIEEPQADFDEPDLEPPAPELELDDDPTLQRESVDSDNEDGDTTVVRGSDNELDFELPDIDPDATDDEGLDFLSDADEIGTKLDLASAYIDMGDASGAREIIDEVLKDGNDEQKAAANDLLQKIGG